MKKIYVSALLVSVLALSACENKSAIEKAEDKVNDALDRRPNEEIRDAVEDASDAAKDLGDSLKHAAKDVAHEAKSAATDVAESAHDAAHKLKD